MASDFMTKDRAAPVMGVAGKTNETSTVLAWSTHSALLSTTCFFWFVKVKPVILHCIKELQRGITVDQSHPAAFRIASLVSDMFDILLERAGRCLGTVAMVFFS
jgi:hypothetical protein